MRFDPQLIRASAGSGKTFRLTNRYLGLLVAGVEPEKILATTFTRKAAHEISERIFARLAEATESEKKAAELGEFIGQKNLTAHQASQYLLKLIREQHRIRVSTLDSFFTGIAKSFAYEIGLHSPWRILDTHQEQALERSAISKLCASLEPVSLLELLKLIARGGARRSVEMSLQEIVRVMHDLYRESKRDAWMWLESDRPLPEEELLKIEKTIAKVQTPKTAKGAPNKTWEKALVSARSNLTGKNWEALLKKGLIAALLCGKDTFARAKIPVEIQQAFKPLLTHIKAVMIGELKAQTEALYTILSQYDQAYSERKTETHGFRLSDIKFLLKTERFFGALNEVYYRLDSQIKHLLLDEFQDTSSTEWLILEPFVEEILATRDNESSFFCVGDIKQAIYGWRGGNAEIFDTLEKRWEQLVPEQMNLSFRSSVSVIDIVNRVFSELNNFDELPQGVRQYWSQNYTPHEAYHQDFTGYAELRQVESSEDERYPAPFLASVEQAKALILNNSALSIGILVRKNTDVALLIYLLEQAGVAASEEGGNPLTDSRAVVLLLSLIHLLDHPGDSIAEFHVLHSPLSKLGFGSELGENKTRRTIARLQIRLEQDGFGPFLRHVTKDLLKELDEREQRRVSQLTELGYVYDLNPGVRFSDFNTFVRLKKVEDQERKSVRVMTVHQSKGLEFDAVLFPEVGKNMNLTARLPVMIEREHSLGPPIKIVPTSSEEVRALSPKLQSMRERDKAEQMNEELSILYVALTRAQAALYMFVPEETNRARLSYSSLLVQTLGHSDSSVDKQVLFSQGDSGWFQTEEKVDSDTNQKELSQSILLQDSSSRLRMLPKKSPSSFEGGGEIDLQKLLQPKRSAAAKRGTVIHAFFEALTWLCDEQEPDLTERCKVAGARLGLTEKELYDYLAEFEVMLSKTPLKELFMKERYTSFGTERAVRKEFPFVYREGDTLINGCIDRLVLCYEGRDLVHAEIIDFKTDKIDSLDEKVEYYTPQLEAYREALLHVTRIKREQVRLTLAFVSHDAVRSID